MNTMPEICQIASDCRRPRESGIPIHQDEIGFWPHTTANEVPEGFEPLGNASAGQTVIRIKVALLYGKIPKYDLSLLRIENSDCADILEVSIESNFASEICSMMPDIIVFYIDTHLDRDDFKAAFDLLRSSTLRVIVVYDGERLDDADLPGVVVCDCQMDAEAARRVIRRQITLIAEIKQKLARIDAWANRISTLSREIVISYHNILNTDQDDINFCHSAVKNSAGHPANIVGFTLAMGRSMATALDDRFGNIEYLQILMFLHQATLAGQGEVLISALGRLIDAPYSTSVRRIDELTKEGYLRKTVDAADKRRINIAITSRGTEAVELFLERTWLLIVELLRPSESKSKSSL